jgi:alpha-1,3-glucan synthase
MTQFVLKSVVVVLLFILTCTTIVYCAPRTPQNAAHNVNYSPDNPFTFYGKMDKQPYKYYPSPDDWRTQSVYQFITDRFADGNPDNNLSQMFPSSVETSDYNLFRVDYRHGGDLKGIRNKLDYIKSLGFTVIWVSPVFQNLENSYHGYAQIDFTLLDDRFGTLDEFREMVQEAHARGIRVIVDIVVNHMANLFYFEGYQDSSAPFRMHQGEYRVFPRGEFVYSDFQINNTYYPEGFFPPVYKDDGYPAHDNSPSNQGSFWFSDFHHNGDLMNYGDAWQNNLGKIYGVMDDLRTTHPRVTAKITAMTLALIASTDIDGIRMDTPMQVPLSFFQPWTESIRKFAREKLGKNNFFMFGEYYCSKNRASTMTGRGKTPDQYGNPYAFINGERGSFMFDAGINYQLFFWFQRHLKDGTGKGDLTEIKSLYDEDWKMFDLYDPGLEHNAYRMLNFYNNHDQYRMSSTKEDGVEKTLLAAAMTTMWPGLPLAYYGDEQGFNTDGTALDGWSREDMMTSFAWRDLPPDHRGDGPNPANKDNFNMTHPNYLYIQNLNNIRRHYPAALQTCDQVYERWSQSHGSRGVYAFSRACGDKRNWALIVWNTWREALPAGGSIGGFFTGWDAGAVIVNVLNPFENYKLGAQGKLENGLQVFGYETKVFVLKESWVPLNPVVVNVFPYHDQAFVTNSGTSPVNTITITFSESLKWDSIVSRIYVNGKQVPGPKISVLPDANQIVINDVATVMKFGVNTIAIDETNVVSAAGEAMFGTFRSRFRIGSQENVIANDEFTFDAKMVKSVSGGQITLTHKAAGAERMRVSVSDDPKVFKFSKWTEYAATSTHSLSGLTGKQLYIIAQYWVDNSAAYVVKSTYQAKTMRHRRSDYNQLYKRASRLY